MRRGRRGKIEDFFGILAGKTKKVATIEEMNEAAAAGWAGLIDMKKGRVGQEMKIAVDTNILVRAVSARMIAKQSDAATQADSGKRKRLSRSQISSLCEFVWVLRSVYRYRSRLRRWRMRYATLLGRRIM